MRCEAMLSATNRSELLSLRVQRLLESLEFSISRADSHILESSLIHFGDFWPLKLSCQGAADPDGRPCQWNGASCFSMVSGRCSRSSFAESVGWEFEHVSTSTQHDSVSGVVNICCLLHFDEAAEVTPCATRSWMAWPTAAAGKMLGYCRLQWSVAHHFSRDYSLNIGTKQEAKRYAGRRLCNELCRSDN